jgi:hypothetical protein
MTGKPPLRKVGRAGLGGWIGYPGRADRLPADAKAAFEEAKARR